MRDAKPVSSLFSGDSASSVPAAMMNDPAISFWLPWMATAPELCQALAPALTHASNLLEKQVHRNAILAIWMSRREMFRPGAEEVASVSEPWEAAVHFMNCEAQEEGSTDRQLFFLKMDGCWVTTWPLIWHGLRVLFSLPRGTKASQVDWNSLLGNPSRKPGKDKRIVLAYVYAALVQAAMRQLPRSPSPPPTALPAGGCFVFYGFPLR